MFKIMNAHAPYSLMDRFNFTVSGDVILGELRTYQSLNRGLILKRDLFHTVVLRLGTRYLMNSNQSAMYPLLTCLRNIICHEILCPIRDHNFSLCETESKLHMDLLHCILLRDAKLETNLQI